MELQTSRLLLRHFMESDIETWAQHILADPEVMRYIPPSQLDPLERARRRLTLFHKHWQEQGFGLWAVTLMPGGELIGQGGLNKIPDTGEVEVDYLLARAYWGQGYATEVARASLWLGFERLGLERIIGLVMPENLASSHVLKKIGMAYELDIHLWGLDLCRYAIQRETYFLRNPPSQGEQLTFQFR